MKKIIAFLLIALICLSLVACGTQEEIVNTETDSSNNNNVYDAVAPSVPNLMPSVDSSNDIEITFEDPIIILDNEYVTIIATNKFAKSELLYGLVENIAYGYSITIENKTDQYINLFLVDISIDGFMLENQDYCRIETADIAPFKKAKSRIVMYADMVNGVELNTIDDLKKLDALIQTGFSNDGNSYGDHINLPFENVLP